ncbi:PIG-L family deacetylase [Catellatospora sp. NPDC049609]|uniref:PIG-L family deacetylase n=1 Tax=Catellatospora sp. NPDC049609 TaxID=3155505 RepID=UPI00343AD0EC
MHRRTALSALLLAGGGAIALGLSRPWERVWSADPQRPGAFLNICAHPDDDLYFLNPDVMQALAEGCPVTSVYLTAGEANGVNAQLGGDDDDKPKPDFEGYAAARQYGIRAAYAAMATGDRESAWRREVRRLPGGVVFETATLVAAPHITLAFLNLRAPLDAPKGGANRLYWLWDGRRAEQPYLRPTDSPLAAPGTLRREDVLAVLASLLDKAAPTVVRTLDPAPEHLSYDSDDGAEYSDHQDHLYAAYFAHEAVRRHRAAGGRAVQVQAYRGYFNKYWPRNLSPAVYERKFSYLDIYGWADGHDCGTPYGCGDLQVGTRARNKRYGRSQTYRHPGGTAWLVAYAGGLAAFAVFAGTAVMWRRDADAADWGAPAVVGGEHLVPHLCAVATPDGRLHLFGVRQDLDVTGPRQTVVHGVQARPGAGFTWTDVGNPDAGGDPVRGRELGMPYAVADADGGLTLFVRDFGRGASVRTGTGDGGWGPWTGLDGDGIRDALVAVTAGPRTDLYAVTDDELLCWTRDSPGGRFAKRRVLMHGPMDGTVSVVRNGSGVDGPVTVGHADGATLTIAQDTGTSTVPANGGLGAVAGLLRDGRLQLVRRNDDGRIDVCDPHPPGEHPSWHGSGVLFTGAPAVAVDATGVAYAAVVGVDGRLWTCRLDAPATALTWRPAPGPPTLSQV